MKVLMKKILLFLLFINLNAFSQEKDSRFPIRLKSVHVDFANYSHGVDVINMFSNHLKINPDGISNYAWGVTVRLLSFVDIVYDRDKYTLSFPISEKYTLDDYEYDYEKYQYGFNFHLYGISLGLGMGQRKFHTFLETDTAYYFHREINTDYTYFKLDYTYATSLYFDMNIFFEQLIFNKNQDADIIIDEGDAKTFGVKLVFGNQYQVAPFFSHSYTNIKLIHKFFGLDNEMNNKFFEEKMGLSIIYNY
jgi:hypothetical protein